MESPEEIVEADGYVFRIVSYRNISHLCFNQLQRCIRIDKLYKHRLFLCCCFSVSASSILSAGLILPVTLPHIEKDAVELEKAFEGTGKSAVISVRNK